MQHFDSDQEALEFLSFDEECVNKVREYYLQLRHSNETSPDRAMMLAMSLHYYWDHGAKDVVDPSYFETDEQAVAILVGAFCEQYPTYADEAEELVLDLYWDHRDAGINIPFSVAQASEYGADIMKERHPLTKEQILARLKECPDEAVSNLLVEKFNLLTDIGIDPVEAVRAILVSISIGFSLKDLFGDDNLRGE